MEIHSSSLTFIPARYNTKNRNDQSPSTNIDQETTPSSVSSSSQMSTVDKKNDAPTLELITNKIEQQRKVLSNSRTTHAVNAYIQQNEQPLKAQRSEFVSGIDLFA